MTEFLWGVLCWTGVILTVVGAVMIILLWRDTDTHPRRWIAVAAMVAGTTACFVWAVAHDTAVVLLTTGLAGWLLISLYEWRGRRARAAARRGGGGR